MDEDLSVGTPDLGYRLHSSENKAHVHFGLFAARYPLTK
jgi:hypothetical protein